MELSDYLALDVRGVGSVGIRQEKCASVLRARPAPIPLLALPCRAMSHNIGALTMGAVQDLDHHDATRSCWVFLSYPLIKNSRSTPLEHLQLDELEQLFPDLDSVYHVN